MFSDIDTTGGTGVSTDSRAGTRENSRASRGELQPSVRDVQTYGRTYGGGMWSDSRGIVIGYPFWDIQYTEQEERHTQIGTVEGVSGQHWLVGIPR